jgi:hypothetical protein
LSLALKHDGVRPGLFVGVNGAWTDFLKGSDIDRLRPRSIQANRFSVLLIHGEDDDVFSVNEAKRVDEELNNYGVPVVLRIVRGLGHSLEPGRMQIYRGIGEYCRTWFYGKEAFRSYHSILVWQARATPLWVYWILALFWTGAWAYMRRRVLKGHNEKGCPAVLDAQDSVQPKGHVPRTVVALRWLAGALTLFATGQTALHLVPLRLTVGERTLVLARNHLIQSKGFKDFDFLSGDSVWRGKRLGVLLTHVNLANYNRELIKWQLDDTTYREFVLSPEIDKEVDGDLAWRRELWENFYPRIRKSNSPEAAAIIVVRFLRERVTVAEGNWLPRTISSIWQRQICDSHGFEAVYVAALRSVGIPARLSADGATEFFTGSGWKPAPRPVIEGLFINAR